MEESKKAGSCLFQCEARVLSMCVCIVCVLRREVERCMYIVRMSEREIG